MLDVPMRFAPASIMAQAVSKSRMPPAAFTPISGPTVSRISYTTATVAPPVEKPVEVFTNWAPARFAARQA